MKQINVGWRVARVILIGAMLAGGCGPEKRKERTMEDLLVARRAYDVERAAESAAVMQGLLARARAEVDESTRSGATTRPSVDILVISGGGDWGAFGAGVLKGWGRVSGDMARPPFDVVTGVSTGALIAPFAFLGDEKSIEQIEHLYRNPKTDWARSRGWFYFMPHNPSFYSLPGLERDLKAYIDRAMLERLVAAGAGGRLLVVNTTNVDLGDMHAWDMVAASKQALATGDTDSISRIMLGSAGVPAIFPSRQIQDYMYVDGAVTGNILYGGRVGINKSLSALWKQSYPNDPPPRIRYWVIFNNQMRFPPQVTRPRWPDIMSRAGIMGTQASTVNAMRHLHAMAEISRLRDQADVTVRIMAIPDEWIPPNPGVFTPKLMNSLADLGEKMGADPTTWRTDPP